MQKKSLETVLYSTIGVIVMAAILIAVNVIIGSVPKRVDLTKEKAFTLSEGTRAILGKIETPMKIRFYFTQSDAATPYSVLLKSYAKKVEDLLAEFKQASHGKVVVEKLDPQPDSDAEDSARMDGIEEQSLPTGEKVYLGIAVSQGLDAKESIAFLSPDRERQMEYDISRAISRVITPEKPVIGVMSALPVFGQPSNPMMAQMGQRGQDPWAIIGELKGDFAVRNVPMDSDKIDNEIKLLLVIHPSNISDKAQYAIDQFIMRGGKLIAFLDAQSLADSRQGPNPMMGQMPGGGSSLDKLLKAWGLQFDTSKVVADRTFKMELGEAGDTRSDRPVWLMLNSDAINSDDIATGELDNLWYFAGGAFTGTPVAGLKETVLMHSSKDSQLVDGVTANFGVESILKDFKPSNVEYALAVRLSGKFKTAFPNGKPGDNDSNAGDSSKTNTVSTDTLKETREDNSVILIGDADMINDNFAIQKTRTPFGVIPSPMNGNLNFAQNAIEQMSGDKNLIAVRSRAVLNRPFTRVKAMQTEAEARYTAEIKELQESRDQAANRLQELQQKKTQNQRYIVSPEQQAEIENLRKKEGEVGRRLRQVEKDLRREVVALQRKIQWYNIAAMPAAVSLVGIGLAIYKRKRTSAK